MSNTQKAAPEKTATRREALEAIAKVAGYIAPATLVLVSSKDSFAY